MTIGKKIHQKEGRKKMFNEMFNHSVKFNYDGKDNAYMSIEDYMTDVSDHGKVLGVWINPKSKHGPRGVIVLDGININVPSHVNAKIEKIRSNPEAVKYINDGKCGVRFYTYEKDGNTYYSADFYDWTE